MTEQIQLRLEEVLLMIPCPSAGCWGLHGAKTAYYYDEDSESHVLEIWPKTFEEPEDHHGNGDDQASGDLLFGLAEFDFTDLIKSVPLETFHFSQMRRHLRDRLERIWRGPRAADSPRTGRGGR